MSKSFHNFYNHTQTTMNMGQLIPVDLFDVLPGDRLTCKRPFFLRTLPLVAPAMATLKFYRQDWFIPYRLVWNNELFQGKKARDIVSFEEFIGGKGDSRSNPMVRWHPDIHTAGSLWDYFGFPVKIGVNPTAGIAEFDVDPRVCVSILPFVAFWFIYSHFFADEILQQTENDRRGDWEYIMETFSTIMERGGNTGIGQVTEDEKWLFEVPHVAWKKDIFTTARPYTQLGDPVKVPVSIDTSKLAIKNKPGQSATLKSEINRYTYLSGPSGTQRYNGSMSVGGSVDQGSADAFVQIGSAPRSSNHTHSLYLQGSAVLADTVLDKIGITGDVDAASLDILDLSRAIALQKLQFNDLKYGTRYNELLLRRGVIPRNQAIQLPQLLGSMSEIIKLSDVTDVAGANDSLGSMAGKGVGMGSGRTWTRSFDEWGMIISLVFVRPDALYGSQGIQRNWMQRSRHEFFWQEYENLGMQDIRVHELWAGLSSTVDEVFGYNDMYYYYRHNPSKVTGEMRRELAYWNLARIFSEKPVLNESFIKCNPSNRLFADQISNQFQLLVVNDMRGFRDVSKTARFSIG